MITSKKVCHFSKKIEKGDPVFVCHLCGGIYSKKIKRNKGTSCRSDDKRKTRWKKRFIPGNDLPL